MAPLQSTCLQHASFTDAIFCLRLSEAFIPPRLSKCSGRPCCAYMLCVSTLEDWFLGPAPAHVSGAGVQESAAAAAAAAAAIHCGSSLPAWQL